MFTLISELELKTCLLVQWMLYCLSKRIYTVGKPNRDIRIGEEIVILQNIV